MCAFCYSCPQAVNTVAHSEVLGVVCAAVRRHVHLAHTYCLDVRVYTGFASFAFPFAFLGAASSLLPPHPILG